MRKQRTAKAKARRANAHKTIKGHACNSDALGSCSVIGKKKK